MNYTDTQRNEDRKADLELELIRAASQIVYAAIHSPTTNGGSPTLFGLLVQLKSDACKFSQNGSRRRKDATDQDRSS